MEKLRLNVAPLHADEVNVEAGLKFDIDKNAKGKKVVTKAGHVQLLFIDKIGHMVISRVDLDVVTAKKLANMLKQQVEKVMEELQKKGLPDAVKEQIEQQKKPAKAPGKKSKSSYFG